MSLPQAYELAMNHARAGRLAQAEGILRQILAQRPKDQTALRQLATVTQEKGDTALAVQLLERALDVNPDVYALQAHIGEMYRRLGRPEKAIEHGKRAIALKPDAPDAHNHLGLAYFDIGDFAAAIACYDAAIAARPRFVEAMRNRGDSLYQLSRFTEAEADYRRALAVNPNHGEGYNNLGNALRGLGRLVEAEQAFKRALSIKPHDVEAATNLVHLYKDGGRSDDALTAARQALSVLERSPARESAETYNLLGLALAEAGRTEDAIDAFQRAIALKPRFADPHNNIGNAHKQVGRLDAARRAFETYLDMTPRTAGTFLSLVDTYKISSGDDKHLRAIESRLAHGEASDDQRMQLSFAAAKAYDDLGRFDDAASVLATANALKRKTVTYDERASLAYFDRIRRIATAELLRAKAGGGYAEARPIFVLGMPRSGTTLVEQMLASHPDVAGAGETKDLSDAVNGARVGGNAHAPFPEFLPDATPEDLARMGEIYAHKLAARVANARRITDKMPSNFYFVGLIPLMLPQAKIVHTVRNPVDTCLSCFSKLFAGELSHCYDLGELGRYYRAYHGLMAHWREVLPAGAFLDVAYEDLVRDPETQARRILGHCELAWDARVLEFHLTERVVTTASAAQVRRPVYSSSVARWRHYEKLLQPLLAELGDLAR